MNDGRYLIYLNDCFVAGYTMPQFCIDNEIKKPLFVLADANNWKIFWELHAQFSHDKRIKPKFVVLNDKGDSIRLGLRSLMSLKSKILTEQILKTAIKFFFSLRKKTALIPTKLFISTNF